MQVMVSYEHEVPMGHRLKNHKGKCRFLHGHNYIVKVTVTGEVEAETGMVLDFAELKRATRAALDEFDHAFVLQNTDTMLKEVNHDENRIIYVDFPPTAEKLAEYWKDLIYAQLFPRSALLAVHIGVRETRDCAVQL